MFWAHYNKKNKQLLPEHLQLVADGSLNAVSESVYFDGIGFEKFAHMAWQCGIFHDLGKYTEYFQTYLLHGVQSHDKDHAGISALFLFNYLIQQIDNPINIDKIFSFLCYLVVRFHHGNLRVHRVNMTPRDMILELQNKQANLLRNATSILNAFPNECDKKLFDKCLCLDEKTLQIICDIPHLIKKRYKNPQWFFFLILLFSILIDQDKLDSGKIEKKFRKQVEPSSILAYLQEKNKGKKLNLNERRENARRDIMENLTLMTDQEIVDQRLFTLTAPTGIGKTLASMQVATYLAQRMQSLGFKIPRIITAIPFVNIIEQTLDEYRKICGKEINLLAHYHLQAIADPLAKENDYPLEKVLLETESWEADVIMTTYVQLFHSLLSGRNRDLKKINKLAGSIVILDEVQALPDRYLPLIGNLIKRLSMHFGTRFILMTATQPRIMDFAEMLKDTNCNVQPVKELLPNNDVYFEGLSRTKFISLIADKAITEDQFIKAFHSNYDGTNAALIVVNTIKRSLSIYNKLQNLYPRRVLYLSTNIIPKARKRVIRKATKYLRYKIPFILVSTQTIEAGVDLDFDLAFRDLAPLPSLIQTAGRVNRNNDKASHLPVYVTEIENDGGMIYGTEQKNRVKAIFKNKAVICEEEFRGLVNEYYSQLLSHGLDDVSKNIWEKGIIELDFEQLNKFELIDRCDDIADVFVEFDDKAKSLADLYIKLRIQLNEVEKEEYFEVKANLKNAIAAMQVYFLSVRVKRIKENKPLQFEDRSLGKVKSNFYWIPKEQMTEYYDFFTGYKDEGEAFIY